MQAGGDNKPNIMGLGMCPLEVIDMGGVSKLLISESKNGSPQFLMFVKTQRLSKSKINPV